MSIKIFLIAFVALFVAGCGSEIKLRDGVSEKFCQLASSGRTAKRFDSLLVEVEKEYGVKRESVRITVEGIFIPLKKIFVEERGLFIALKVLFEGGAGRDPFFKKIADCVYAYHIKG